MKRIYTILLAIALLTIALAWPQNAQARQVATITNCVEMKFHQTMICEWGIGVYTRYTAGVADVVLAGPNVPTDDSVDGQLYSVSGYLLENGSCTMLYVTNLTSCLSVDGGK